MMKRTTLGNLSGSALNSRLSVGPNASTAKAEVSAHKASGFPRRASVAPTPQPNSVRRSSTAAGALAPSSARRSSAFLSSAVSSTLKTDPRPIADKSFMNASVRNLICYLSEHGFDQAISPKLLTNPTSKDFQHILIFLLRQIDATYSFQNRFEDDVRAIFKNLRYPFAVSKSALHAVGSPHTWPALLGALSWLLELLTYDEEAQTKSGNNDQLDTEAEGNRMFFDYLSRTYKAFLDGDDNFDEMDAELCESFEAKNQLVEEEIVNIEAELEQIGEQLEKMRGTESPLAQHTARRDELTANLDKFNKLVSELETYKARTATKLKEKEQEIARQEQELRDVAKSKDHARSVIQQQENDAIDVQRIERDRATLRSSNERTAEQRSNVERQHKLAEDAGVEATEKLERALGRYAELADTLQLIPATAENANGVHFKATLTRNASITRAEDMLTVNLKDVIKPALTELKEAFVKIFFDAQEEALSMQNRIDVLDEENLLKNDEIQALQSRFNKLESEYRAHKETMAEQLRTSTDEMESHEHEVHSLKRENDELLRASQRRVTDAHVELRDRKEVVVKLRREANASVLAAVENLTNHKAHVQESLAAVQEHFDQLADDVSSIAVA